MYVESAFALTPPASVGSRYLEALGLIRPLVKFTGLSGVELGWEKESDEPYAIAAEEPRGDLDPRLLGWSMSALLRRTCRGPHRPHRGSGPATSSAPSSSRSAM